MTGVSGRIDPRRRLASQVRRGALFQGPGVYGVVRQASPAVSAATVDTPPPDDFGPYLPISWTFVNPIPDGEWADDGPSSLDADGDGLNVRFVRPAELDVDTANHAAYVNVIFPAPSVPVGSTATSVSVAHHRTLPTSGTVNSELMDASGTTVLASETGSTAILFTTDSAAIADIIANGCIWRMHSGDVAEVTNVDSVTMTIAWV